MKKIMALILAVLLAFGSVGCAEEMDLSGMSAEELQQLIDQARLELVKYHPAVAEGEVLYEDENVKVTLTGNVELDEYGNLFLHVTLENHSSHNLAIALENVSCNGWAVWDGYAEVPAGKMAKTVIEFTSAAEFADLTCAEDVQDIEADLKYYDTDDYSDLITPVHVAWIFGA